MSAQNTNYCTVWFVGQKSWAHDLIISLSVLAGVLFLLALIIWYFRCYKKERGEYDPRRELMRMGGVNNVGCT